VLQEGRVSEHGTPADLVLIKGGWFAEMAAQAGETEEPAIPEPDHEA
jgi:ABC-type multidrug transport system fused ATPase/permease subunit